VFHRLAQRAPAPRPLSASSYEYMDYPQSSPRIGPPPYVNLQVPVTGVLKHLWIDRDGIFQRMWPIKNNECIHVNGWHAELCSNQPHSRTEHHPPMLLPS
jgi:hypothetical protein